MGNGNITGTKNDQKQKSTRSNSQQFGDLYNQKKSTDHLIFYACTDKARVITEILEERGWSRTKDHNVTNFTIKWCLEHQVDWKKFQEGKQLINNIPGQITFADKVNLWYTIRDYLNSRRTLVGNNIQTFLPMTFVLDNEDEVAEFLRIYKKQNRIWICKPRYSYAGQGIHVISVNSDLETIFKIKHVVGNRIQHEPKTPGHLMQEYISRPLLIKGRKFDIRVHWLVAWTKPLLVLYNHHASVIRLSLNLYREFDFDRATHLTNLSVQENHHRYAFSQEATGMTMQQLNNYFNQCFLPFHPKMPQDWVMTVMQDRMQTIIRQVIRASKNKLERIAGHFGLFGCDFLLDENFRLWLLEVNDNPGVGWGNSQVNSTTKPLFEETLNIVLECFDKHKHSHPLLPIECLKNYQLIYDENNDAENILHDDNQVFNERITARHSIKDSPADSPLTGTIPHIKSSRIPITTATSTTSEIISPVTSETNLNKNIISKEKKEPMIPICNNIDYERLTKIKELKAKYTFRIRTRSLDKLNYMPIKRSITSANIFHTVQRKKFLELKPKISDKRRHIQKTKIINPTFTEEQDKKEDAIIIEEVEPEQTDSSIIPSTNIEQNENGNSATVCAVH
ncbi:unnamed protein product [Rotaria sp. Silwood1]|nr:unnamed protein product [Rotaria sp. Silwood1]CAF1095858.1 unnamed protein product [Rotaria sp. Silwood1]CAF3418332.1 unnamed protein product [Rotaria sp. Silwood1]